MIFNLKELVDFMSIGTLMAYTLVAASVMILRYRNDPLFDPKDDSDQNEVHLELSDLYRPRKDYPTASSTKVVTYASSVLSKYTKKLKFFKKFEILMNFTMNL